LQIWEGNKNFTLDVEAKEELYSGAKRAKGRNSDVEFGIRNKRKLERKRTEQEDVCLIHYGDSKTGNFKENSKDQRHLIKIFKL
jgi:hypothetical protein